MPTSNEVTVASAETLGLLAPAVGLMYIVTRSFEPEISKSIFRTIKLRRFRHRCQDKRRPMQMRLAGSYPMYLLNLSLIYLPLPTRDWKSHTHSANRPVPPLGRYTPQILPPLLPVILKRKLIHFVPKESGSANPTDCSTPSGT